MHDNYVYVLRSTSRSLEFRRYNLTGNYQIIYTNSLSNSVVTGFGVNGNDVLIALTGKIIDYNDTAGNATEYPYGNYGAVTYRMP